MPTPIPWRPRGVVQAAQLQQAGGAGRYLLAPPLDAFVEHLWTVAWDLRGQAPVRRETLPHPSVHLVVEAGRSGLAGVHTRRFSRQLEGQGRVLGIKFHPGCFRPFWPDPVIGLANRVIALDEAFGPAGIDYEAQVLAHGDDVASALACAEAFLLARLPQPDASAQLARALCGRIREEPRLCRAELVAEEARLSLRALQRLFREYVGASPKWVVQRYRLHEAMARLESGQARDLAALAVDLGYFDQAHFIRDFKALLGCTPTAYLKAARADSL